MALLYGVAGPLKGAAFALQSETVSVGRHASNHLCIGDPSVSRQHCLIEAFEAGFRLRDLRSNNGTFVNGAQIVESILADGDKIRIGDTVLVFASHEAQSSDVIKCLPDNGVNVGETIQRSISDSVDTAVQRLFALSDDDGGRTARARAFLRIGGALNSISDVDRMQIELLGLILEVVPADQAAIVLVPHSRGGEPAIVGWDRLRGETATVPVSRTLVTKAIRDSLAIFSDDVAEGTELSGVSSLSLKRVSSVIVVPLIAGRRSIGAIYLDATDSSNRLNREHFEFVAVVGEHVGPALDSRLRLRALNEENQRLKIALKLEHSLIGGGDAMCNVVERLAKIARTDATVLIRGETGTGKELAARAIHQNSSRGGRPFEAINCALLRDTLLESELFGHERGAFTGAIAQKRGKLELADGGTLFLDELAELGAVQQGMLLRVLQTREFQRLGGSRTLRADIRVIAATNSNLDAAIQKETFREDLYYRLNVVSVTMPPLRQRIEDIPPLVDHFVDIYSRKNKRSVSGVSPEALRLLIRYAWPGNIRELENAIEFAIVFGSADQILPEDLPDALLGSQPEASPGYHHSVREAKCNIVKSALVQASGNYAEAARSLGIHVNNLHRLLRELNVKSELKGGGKATATIQH